METERKRNILLGFFVIGGIIIFIAGIFLIGAKNELFKKSFIVSARFHNATGLKVGSNVRFNGVKVGIVKEVNLLNDSMVQVDLKIEDNKKGFIMNNSVASIASDGLMGDKIVNISWGGTPGFPIKDHDVLEAHNPLVMDEVMQTLLATNENVKVISDNLRKLSTDLNADNGTIQALYKDPQMKMDLKQSFSNLNLVIGKVLGVSTNLQQITQQLQHGKGLAGELLNDSSLGNSIVFTLNKLKETSNELDNVSEQLMRTSQHINNGKGTVNMLLTDTAFSANLQQSLINIKQASTKLDENMEALKHSFLTRGWFRKQAKKNKEQP